jgi:hypothetical protein
MGIEINGFCGFAWTFRLEVEIDNQMSGSKVEIN